LYKLGKLLNLKIRVEPPVFDFYRNIRRRGSSQKSYGKDLLEKKGALPIDKFCRFYGNLQR
jgi:hypothetical protein